MSNPTTNEKIALELGWEKREALSSNQAGGHVYVWYPPEGKHLNDPLSHKPPDFEHDWNLNGPLQPEMWEAGFSLEHDNIDGTYYWWKPGEDGPDALDDDREDTTDVLVASALDWLAWRGEGKK